MYDDEYDDEIIDDLDAEEQDALSEQFKKFGKEDRDTQEQFAQQSLGVKDAKRAELSRLEQELAQLIADQSQIVRKIKLIGLDIKHEEYLQTRQRIVAERELIETKKRIDAPDKLSLQDDNSQVEAKDYSTNSEEQVVSENERDLKKSEEEYLSLMKRLDVLKKAITEKQRAISGLQYVLLRM